MSLASEAVERAVTGETLYESTRAIQIAFGDIFDARIPPPWEELSWSERDKWEADADGINEARRNS